MYGLLEMLNHCHQIVVTAHSPMLGRQGQAAVVWRSVVKRKDDSKETRLVSNFEIKNINDLMLI